MNNVENRLWKNFEQYFLQEYARNPTSTAALGIWYSDLYSRRQAGEALRLDFIQANNEVTGVTFKGFSLNDTFVVSSEPGVLTLPFPSQKSDGKRDAPLSDDYVGIWLHDCGDHTALHREAETIALSLNGRNNANLAWDDPTWRMKTGTFAALDLATEAFSSVDFIATQIVEGLAQSFSRRAVDLLLAKGEVRISKERPQTADWHSDNSERQKTDSWNYVIISPFLRTGTEFRVLDCQTRDKVLHRPLFSDISVPTYTTSSHISYRLHKRTDLIDRGPKHRARGHAEGRSILIYPEFAKDRMWLPIRDDVFSPWKFKTISGSRPGTSLSSSPLL